MDDVLDLTATSDGDLEDQAMAAGHRAYRYAMNRIQTDDDMQAMAVAEEFGVMVASELWGEVVTDARIAELWREEIAYRRRKRNR